MSQARPSTPHATDGGEGGSAQGGTGRSTRATGAAKPQRADARRSIEKALVAATECLGRNPEAGMSEIAKAAGVGRVTLYTHFPTREDLIEAAMQRLLDQGDQHLEGIDLDGDPREVLTALIESSWLLMAQAGAVLEAAQRSLPPGRVRELHAKPEKRINTLISRGQADGVFRDDQPAAWLASVLHHLLKGAADDVAQGRIDAQDAPGLITATVLSAYRG